MSDRRANQLLDFLKESDILAENFGFRGPTIILGITDSETGKYENLLSDPKWQLRDTTSINDFYMNRYQDENSFKAD